MGKNGKHYSRANTVFHIALPANLYDGEHPTARDAN